MEAETGASACAALAVTGLRDAKPKTTARVIAAAAIFLTEHISSFIRHPPEAFAYKSRFAFVIGSFATCLQHFCFTSATLSSQELHRNVSPSRDFSRFFQGKYKKSKSKGLKAFHECNKHITDSASYVPCVLQFSSKSGFRYNFVLRFDFRNVFVMFRICIFLHFNSFQCINRKRNTQILCFLSVARCPSRTSATKKARQLQNAAVLPLPEAHSTSRYPLSA